MNTRTMATLVIGGVSIATAAYAALFTSRSPEATRDNAKTDAQAIEDRREVPPGFREYHNPFYGISILYPDTFSVSEYPEPVTKLTTVFEDPASDFTFQVHVLPYGDAQITETRLKLDIPSGIMRNPLDIMVGGVRATMFESEDASLGATREVWFLNGGFLYEITTPIAHDAALSEIMRSWEFIYR